MTDYVWLTYEELSSRIGIDAPAARRMAKRQNWDIQPGSHPRAAVRVKVPLSLLNFDPSAVKPTDSPSIAPAISLAATSLAATSLAESLPATATSPESFDELLRQGESLVNTGKFDDAIALLERALGIQPGNIDVNDRLFAALAFSGFESFDLGDFNACTTKLSKALGLNLSRLFTSSIMIKCFMVSADSLLNLDRPAESIPYLQKLHDILPQNPEVSSKLHMALSVHADTLGKLAIFPEAISLFDQACSLMPDDIASRDRLLHVLTNAGIHNLKNRNFRDAVACFERIMLFHPDSETTRNRLRVAKNNTILEEIKTNCTTRMPIKLISIPFAMRLYLHTFYNHFHPANKNAMYGLLDQFLEATETGNWESLSYGTLALLFEHTAKLAKFRATNSQFVSLDTSNTVEFENGYEPATGALIDRLVPADGVLCDIGANWGYFSFYLATRPSFHGTIHAFEPIPDTFADLRGLVVETGLEKVIHTYNTALSNASGRTTMSVSLHLSGMAKIGHDEDNCKYVEAALAKLDDLKIGRVDFMKVDTEGHEREVIEGALGTIDAYHPYIIFEDTFEPESTPSSRPDHITTKLLELGYQLFVPMWLRNDGVYYPALGGDPAAHRLVLIPMDYGTGRQEIPGHINILACHSSRIPQMLEALT